MIGILDQLRVKPGELAACDRQYREVYFPLAQSRGMKLEHAWMTPPFVESDRSGTLFYMWSVPDPQGWWRMRYGGLDPRVRTFWRELEPCLLERQRLFLGATPAEQPG